MADGSISVTLTSQQKMAAEDPPAPGCQTDDPLPHPKPSVFTDVTSLMFLLAVDLGEDRGGFFCGIRVGVLLSDFHQT